MTLVKVDTRMGAHGYKKGAKHLELPLRTLLGPTHEVKGADMKYGDVAFSGEGPDECPTVRVGVELKTISDFLSSLESGRLIEHQLPGLQTHYNVSWLLIEGRWRPNLRRKLERIFWTDKHGYLDIYSGMAGRRGWMKQEWRQSGWKYDPLMQIICGLAYRFGIRTFRTDDRNETLWWLTSQVNWWSKPWDQHHSGEAWSGYNAFGAMSLLRKPTECEKVAAVLDGIGAKKARLVAKHFGSIRAMVTAKPEDWVGIRQSGLTKTGRKHPGITLSSAILIQKQLDWKGKRE